MEISLDAGAVAMAILVHLIGFGFMLRGLTEQMRKSAEQMDRLIIAAEKAQAREEAKAQFAISAMHSKIDG